MPYDGVGKITEIFWRATPGETEDPSPREVVRHALACLAAFEAGKVANPQNTKPISLMELLADVGIEENLVYASPELARGESFDERSLVFTLGVLIFERLTGRHPFGTPDNPHRVARIRRGELGSGVNFFPKVPSNLRIILMRAMGPFPEERFRSLEEMKGAMRQFISPEILTELQNEQPPKPPAHASTFFEAPTRVAPVTTVLPQGARPEWMVEPEPIVQVDLPESSDRDRVITDRVAPLSKEAVNKMMASSMLKKKHSPKESSSRDRSSERQASHPSYEPSHPMGDPQVGVLQPAPPSPSKVAPLLYALAGAAVASLAFVIFSFQSTDSKESENVGTSNTAMKGSERGTGQSASTLGIGASNDKKSVGVKDAAANATQTTTQLKSPTASMAGTPIVSGQQLLAKIEDCIEKENVKTVRIAVYLMPDGKVRRAFVAKGPRVKRKLITCVKKKAKGLVLPLKLEEAEYVEWRYRFKPDGIQIQVLRPPRFKDNKP